MACAGYPETDGVPEATNRSSRARPCAAVGGQPGVR